MPSGGFTLIELMVVVTLIAVFASLTMPAMSRTLRGTSMKASGNKLAELIRFGYASAVSRKRPVIVNIHPETRRCWVSLVTTSLPWLEVDEGETSQTLASMEMPGEFEILLNRRGPSSSGAAVNQEWETIAFSSDGRTDDVLIELSNGGGDRFMIEILGASGRVSVEYERAEP